MSTDYLPKKDADLRTFATSFATLIKAAPATYGLVAADATVIDNAAKDFATKFELASNPATRTEAAIDAKETAKATLSAIVRGYAMQVKSNRAVSNEAKINLGIGTYDFAPTPVPPPTTFPIIKVLGATPRQHELRFADSATPEKKARPEGTAGLILFCQILEPKAAPPIDTTGAPFQALVTRASFTMDFAAQDVGKTAYYYARWYTRTGLTGPWSQVASMTVAG